jgi:hypothetical protein
MLLKQAGDAAIAVHQEDGAVPQVGHMEGGTGPVHDGSGGARQVSGECVLVGGVKSGAQRGEACREVMEMEVSMGICCQAAAEVSTIAGRETKGSALYTCMNAATVAVQNVT